MADKFMNIFDVEKGKRLQYYKDYYLVPTIITIIIIAILFSVIKTVFFYTKPDSSVFIATSDKHLYDDTLDDLKKAIESNISDINGDGETKLDFQSFIVFSKATENNSEEMKTTSAKFTAVLTIGNCIIQIVDDASFEYLNDEEMIASYSDFERFGYKNTENREGLIKILLSETKLSDIPGLQPYNDSIYLTMRPPVRESDKTPEGIKKFEEQTKVFINLLK